MGKHRTLGARLKAGAVGAVLAAASGVAFQAAPAHALPGDYGCVAQAGSSCSFGGLSGGIAPTGYVSATNASWRITHRVFTGGAYTTVTDASGTGPGIGSVAFPPLDNPSSYTLTVDAGTGAVTAGTPESGPAPSVPSGQCGQAVGVSAGDTCGDAAAISAGGTATSQGVAASGIGDASGTNCTGAVSCISASGTGDASNTGGVGSCGFTYTVAVGCVAVSGTGNASNSAGLASCGVTWILGVAAGCVAASGTGSASNAAGNNSCGFSWLLGVTASCVAVSGAGNASNSTAGGEYGSCGAPSGLSVDANCVAVSGTGDASNNTAPTPDPRWACGSSAFGSLALGCVAVSGTGNASNDVGSARRSCGVGPGGAGVGCVAVSGAGNASNTAGDDSCGKANTSYIVLPGAGVGCVAVSGTGSASNTAGVNSCGTVPLLDGTVPPLDPVVGWATNPNPPGDPTNLGSDIYWVDAFLRGVPVPTPSGVAVGCVEVGGGGP